ncbi:Elongation factor 1-alpha [Candidatus Norongarragalina meridionalis]|nr:Elongation factor 1-alpha [Candidatus Norongarragalina meridionalis]
MTALNIAVLGADSAKRAEAAQSIGKKANVDDMGFYHTVFQGKIVSAIDPIAYPDKLSVLSQTLALSDVAMVLADVPSPALGEIIVALDILKMPAVFVSQMDLTPFISKTSLKDSKIFTDVHEAKNHLLSLDISRPPGTSEILVDHCFEVKGVGTVVLGVVKRGAIAVHDTMMAHPLEREIEIKSIQRNDVDSKNAETGDRVGLCVKNAKAGEIDRGTLLANDGIAAKDFTCELTAVSFLRSPVTSGTYHLGAGTQFEPVKFEGEVAPGASASVKMSAEKPIALMRGEAALLCNLNAKGLRVVGAVSLH